ncbi:MAG: 8-oxo-dGTP diphosphatase [Patescibacteria group bacterium]
MILATLGYIRRNGQTLMLHRVKKENDVHEGKWNGLGGKIKKGETPEECIIREIREESGLIVKESTLKGILTFPDFDGQNDWCVFLFVINDFDGQLTDSNEGNLRWIDNDKIDNLNLWEGDRIFIPWLNEPGFYSGKFVYQNKKLIDYYYKSYHQ